jgi:hypothetical protein
MTTKNLNLSIESEIKVLSSFKGIRGKIYPYIINAIDFEGYELTEAKTTQQLLQNLFDTFYSEKIKHHDNWVAYYGNIQNAFKDWVSGLPSCFNIDFENYKILELLYEFEYLQKTSNKRFDERREDSAVENWFNFITVKTFQLFHKYEVKMLHN